MAHAPGNRRSGRCANWADSRARFHRCIPADRCTQFRGGRPDRTDKAAYARHGPKISQNSFPNRPMLRPKDKVSRGRAELEMMTSLSVVAKINGGERRQIELNGLSLAVGRGRRGVDPPGIADIGSAIKTGIAVEYLKPGPGERNADPVTVARHGRHVANDQDRRPVSRIADEGKNRIGAVVSYRPLKGGRPAVALIERWFRRIEAVEVADGALHPGMHGLFERAPIERAVMIPLPFLGELAAHEQQLLAGMGPHEAQIGAQIGKTLPAIARHFADKTPIPVDDLVMRKGEA